MKVYTNEVNKDKLAFGAGIEEFRGDNSLRTLRVFEREGPASQTCVAKALGMTVPSALGHFRKLADGGLLKLISKKNSPGRGRPRELWDINRKTNYVIGVCIQPPLVHFGLADFDDKLLIKCRKDISEEMNLDALLETLDQFMERCRGYVRSTKGKLWVACACLAGKIKDPEGRELFDNSNANMPFLSGFDIAQYFFDKYSLRCWPGKLAMASCFGELSGIDPGTTVAVIEWDLGVGVYPCRDKQILSFDHIPNHRMGTLHDFGHMRIIKDGQPCRCGKKGCLEAYVGGWSIIERLNRPDIKKLLDIVSLARQGDQQVIEELTKSVKILGSELLQIILLLGVEKIIFTGPLSSVFPCVKDVFCESLQQRFTDEEVESLNPSPSDDPEGKMVIGACRAAKHYFFNLESVLAKPTQKAVSTIQAEVIR